MATYVEFDVPVYSGSNDFSSAVTDILINEEPWCDLFLDGESTVGDFKMLKSDFLLFKKELKSRFDSSVTNRLLKVVKTVNESLNTQPSLERRLRRLEEATSKKRKVNEEYGEEECEYLMRNGKFGEYHDAQEFGTLDAANIASHRYGNGYSMTDEDTNGNFIVYRLISTMPWETEGDLLEAIVHRLTKEWSSDKYDIIEAAFKPSVAVIFKRLKDTEFDNLH